MEAFVQHGCSIKKLDLFCKQLAFVISDYMKSCITHFRCMQLYKRYS